MAGEFPIVDIASIGVQVKADAFGGKIDAALIGGILKVDASGNMIDPLDTVTPVKDRIFFVGVEGGFAFSGVAVTIRFALSELGPLGVLLNASTPTGILLEPNTGLSMNDFTASVEFFKTLPSIDDPMGLRAPAFQLPQSVSVDGWLAGVKQQVVAQYRAIQANPSLNGFTAAFTQPMTITGSAKIFTIYTSQYVFNGQVTIKFSTDGKILDHRPAELRGRPAVDLRPPVRRPLAGHPGQGHGAVPRRRARPGPRAHALRQAADGLPQRLRRGGLLRRARRGAREPDRRPRRPARGGHDLERHAQRPRLHRRQLRGAGRLPPRRELDPRPRRGLRDHRDRRHRRRSTRTRRRSCSTPPRTPTATSCAWGRGRPA